MQTDLATILARIAPWAGDGTRRVIAVAGPPGAGKSTLAEALVAALTDTGTTAALLPMDGFHLDNRLLDERGQRGIKGAPQTFDAAGFAATVARLKTGAEVIHPVFDRARDLAIAGAGRIAPSDQLVVVEGNYLLLDQPVWRDLAPLWDLTVMIAPPVQELERRLRARWRDLGCDAAGVQAHLDNDMANVRLVLSQSRPPDLMLSDLTLSDLTLSDRALSDRALSGETP